MTSALFRYAPIRSFCALLLIMTFTSLVLGTPIAMAENDGSQGRDDCAQGSLDGALAARGNPVWLLAGCIGIIGFVIVMMHKPAPPVEALMGRSAEYSICYTNTYGSKSRNKNVVYQCVGWAAAAAILLSTVDFDEM